MIDILKQSGYDFSFNPAKCSTCGGRCCTGESGYIWVGPNERDKMAEFLKVSSEEFKEKYLIKVGYKFSLKEKDFDGGYACIFFDIDKLQCGIYEARPNQCKTFPFWDYFKTNLEELEKECPGILV